MALTVALGETSALGGRQALGGKRLSRRKPLWRSALLGAVLLTTGLACSSTALGQPAETETIPQVTLTGDAAGPFAQALEAIRKGDFAKGTELLDASAKKQTDLTKLSRWADEFNTQRTVLVEERRKAYNETITDVQKLIAAGKDEAAIDFARGGYVLAEDKVEYTKQPWMKALMERVQAMAVKHEGEQQWVKAQRLYTDLSAIEPFNLAFSKKLNATVQHTRMLQFYAPDYLRAMLDEDPKTVKEINAILRPESTTQPTSQPTSRPFDRALLLDWREELKGIKADMLWTALINVRSYYWREPDFQVLMDAGFEGLRSLVDTKGLEEPFPGLADGAKKAEFLAKLTEMEERMKATRKGTTEELLAAGQLFPKLLELNRTTVGLPEEVVVYEFADAALATLDKFTNMLWPAQWEEFTKRTQGEFSGVGIQIINDEDGNIKVVTPIEDSPAFKAGVKAGDLITAVDGKALKGVTTTAAVRIITGAIGTPVTITIANADGTGAHDIALVRDTIKVASLKGFQYKPGTNTWDYMLDSDQRIGYVRLTDFTKTSATELNKATDELKKLGARGLIFDLRGNGGGLLTTAIDVVNKFVSSGTIVSTHADRQTAIPAQVATAKKEDDEITMPVIVLINQGSASASEIFAGAMKDLGRALIIGERSYGKGSVQMPMDVTKNRGLAYLKMTIAHYYLPSGRSLHKDDDSTTWGVEPDVIVEMTPDQMITAQLGRLQLDVLRQTGEVPPEPATRPAGGVGSATTRPTIRNADDLIARDSQLGAALLVMRLKLNGAEVAGTAHASK